MTDAVMFLGLGPHCRNPLLALCGSQIFSWSFPEAWYQLSVGL